MPFPPSLPEGIRKTREKNKQIDQPPGVPLEPRKFARMFVEANV